MNLREIVSQKNFNPFWFFICSFSFLFWFDYFISIGKTEINPLYNSTNKFIFFPIVIVSVLLMKKFWSNKMKLPMIFLLSFFAFAFVWNVAGIYAQSVIVDRIDATHQVSGLSSSGNGFIGQNLPTLVQGSSATGFDWNIGCSAGTFNISYGIGRATGGVVDTILALNKTTITDVTASTTATEIYNLSFGTPVSLPAISGGQSYFIFFNTSNSTDGTGATQNGCTGTTNSQGTITRVSGTDTAGENAGGSGARTSSYLSTTFSPSSPTSSYRLLGVNAIYSNQTSTSTCNALNGASCSSTTPALTYPTDCSFNFLATLTHNVNLFNGSTQTQIATATSEFILPASNQFSNITIVNWTNEASRNLNLTFTKTNYQAGDTVQARCSLNMNSINSTSGISTCTLATSCLRVLESVANDTVQANPTSIITEAGANQILEFFLSPFMIMTILAFVIGGIVTVSMGKFMQGHGGMIFISVIFVMFFAYTIFGIYPIFVGIVMTLVIGLILTKMIIGVFKGGA